MKIHEYQAKELLAGRRRRRAARHRRLDAGRGGQGVRRAGRRRSCSRPRSTPAAAARAASRSSGKDFGGVKFVTKRDDVAPVAEVMFKYPLVTKQTGEEGQKVVEGPRRRGEGEDRPRGLPRHGARPRRRPAGADGLRRGRRRDRGGRRQAPREDPQAARRPRPPACRRSRRASWPSTWASPASR